MWHASLALIVACVAGIGWACVMLALELRQAARMHPLCGIAAVVYPGLWGLLLFASLVGLLFMR